MGWKDKINLIFIMIYYLIAFGLAIFSINEIFNLSLLSEFEGILAFVFIGLGIIQETYIFIIFILIGLLLGIIAYIDSYKAIIVKLIPTTLLSLLYLIVAFNPSKCYSTCPKQAMILNSIMVLIGYPLLLLLITFIANYFMNRENKI